jgi:hypothetical protein
MTNIKSVLAFGDSTPAGCELAGPLEQFKTRAYLTGKKTIEELDLPGKLLTFPQKVADHFNVPCYNYAMTGGSNDRSIRLLIEAVQEHPDSLVLFGWGRPHLKDIFYPDGGIGCDKDNFFQAGAENFDTEFNKKFVETYYYHNNLKQQMFCVDAICRLHAAEFLHIPLYLKSTEPSYVPDAPNRLRFGDYNNAEDWAKEKQCTKLLIHYGQDFHKELANLIIETLVKKGAILND